jgi:hypothetical protein
MQFERNFNPFDQRREKMAGARANQRESAFLCGS